MTGVRLVTVGAGLLSEREDEVAIGLARSLLAGGLPVAGRGVVDEDETALEAELAAAVERPGVVLVLAAPGGSSGEIVRRVAARLAGVRLVLNDRLLEALEQDFARRGRAMPHRLDRLALLPQGATLWAAPEGEPGWAAEVQSALVAVLPLSSPHVERLAERWVLPAARERLAGGEALAARTLRTTGLTPAEVEERLGPWLGREGDVAVTCVVEEEEVWVRLRARGATAAMAAAVLARVAEEVAGVLGEHCYGRDDETLERAVGRLLLERGLWVAVAESCTGGLIAHRLTNVPGSSRYVERGVVVYSNRAKQELLGVPEGLLRAHGAVSGPVAEAMVRGVCHAAGVACGVAVTGIAGPDGGTPDKPVGTVFAAAAAPSGVMVERCRFTGGREAIKRRSATAALGLLRRAVLA